MSARGWAVGAVLLSALVAAAIARQEGRSSAVAPTAGVAAEPEQERVRLFWQSYRAATRHRIAGEREEAARRYAQALALDPVHEDALYYLGNVEMERGRYPEAAHAWERLVEVNPTSARAHARLGDLRFCVGAAGVRDVRRAVESYEAALRINREQTGPLLRLGQAALLGERIGAAAEYFAAVLGSHAASDEAHYYVGYLAWKAGDGAAALEHYRQALPVAGAEAGGPVIGEGDTRRGTAPMVADEVVCEVLHPFMHEVRSPSGAPAMTESYRRLDSELARLRTGDASMR